MKWETFDKLPEITLDEFFEKDWNVGDKFLLGESLIEQKSKKGIGDDISYFEIIDISNSDEYKNTSYIQRFDKLE